MMCQAFTAFGDVRDANIVMDRETGRSRGFGFVTFAEKAQAEAACTQMDQAVRLPLHPFGILMNTHVTFNFHV
jgi:RNA recognition motif-containing protein